MKKLLLVASLLLITSCVTQSPRVTPEADEPRSTETVYRCTYKYDSKYNLVFVGSKRVEFRPPTLPELLVYHITDLSGVKWAINEYDWENYTCIPSITQG